MPCSGRLTEFINNGGRVLAMKRSIGWGGQGKGGACMGVEAGVWDRRGRVRWRIGGLGQGCDASRSLGRVRRIRQTCQNIPGGRGTWTHHGAVTCRGLKARCGCIISLFTGKDKLKYKIYILCIKYNCKNIRTRLGCFGQRPAFLSISAETLTVTVFFRGIHLSKKNAVETKLKQWCGWVITL